MAEEKKREGEVAHGTDESVDLQPVQMRIDPEAEQNPPQQEMDGRHSRRLSADLPRGLPTDNLHFTGTPQGEISSGFSDLRSGEQPHLEDENAQRPRRVQQDAGRAGGENMADTNERNNQQDDAGYDRPRGEKSRYDAEQEIPDPEQVGRDIEQAERTYGDKGNKVA